MTEKMNFEYEDGEVSILRVGIFNLQCCAPSTMAPDEVERRVNAMYTCGTMNGWRMSTREEVAPITCADNPDRKHYVLDA